MRLAITGASGFIGQSFVERMFTNAARGGDGAARDRYQLKLLASSAAGIERLRTKWPTAEIVALHDRNGDVRGDALAGTDALLHLGWSTVPGTAKSDPIGDLHTNVEDGLRLLLAVVAHGVQRVVFVSTGGMVYGEPQYLPIDERHPTHPRTPYGVTKLLFEHYLRCMADLHGFRQVVFRPGNVYGRTTGPVKPQGVVEHWLGSLAAGRMVQVWNGLDVVRDYVHVDDLVEVLIRSLQYDGGKEIFNVGTGVGTSLSGLAAIMQRVTGRAIAIDQVGTMPPEVTANILDPGLVSSELGVRPSIDLEEGIGRTWSALRG